MKTEYGFLLKKKRYVPMERIQIEFRSPEERENYRLLARIPCETHFEVIRYLLKDVVDVPGFERMLVTSTEIDEDRGVYVVYVTDLKVS